VKVGDLVTLKSSGRLMKVLQIHAKTREVCVVPADNANRPGLWIKQEAIEVPSLQEPNQNTFFCE
jgi:hypothetical protein